MLTHRDRERAISWWEFAAKHDLRAQKPRTVARMVYKHLPPMDMPRLQAVLNQLRRLGR